MKKQPTGNQAPPPPVKKKRNNRTAGHTYETDCAKQLRDMGFVHVVTSRSESRSRDNEKIDLINKNEGVNGRLPYNIQCKNSCVPVNYKELLIGGNLKYKKTEDGTKVSVRVRPMPKVNGVINVIFHKFTDKASASGKFITKGEFAILEKGDFLAMVGELEALRKQAPLTMVPQKKRAV